MSKHLLAFVAAIAIATPAFSQEVVEDADKVTPLFAESGLLEVTIDGPVESIVKRAKRSTDPYPATLAAAGESLPIELSARGVSRRIKSCRFPPLRVRFTGEKPDGSLFRKQGGIKLVTHCQNKPSAEQTVLREYAAYRLYNVVTPLSHKVRLAQINYVDQGKEVADKLGFFIEDTDDLARRVGMKEVDTGRISSKALRREDTARYLIFQYMIGNTDWAAIAGPVAGDCCHNSKLVGAEKESLSELIPVAYDFDSSGLVDAPYAEPNDSLGIRRVTQRVYRGFCHLNDLMPGVAAEFRAARPQLEAELAAIPRLEDKERGEMQKYLASFYSDIADDQKLEKALLSDCR